jgi:DNA-binding transcriptional LysR family regulator
MKNLDWSMLQLFSQVARSGGLSGASRLTGLSPATVGRHMADLEAAIGRPLFQRSRTGYELTEDGRALLDHVAEMESASWHLEQWCHKRSGRPLVRIACGTWLAWWLSRRVAEIVRDREPLMLDFFIAERRARLIHRESDIGIRAFRPEEENLASIKLGSVAYASYRARTADPEAPARWVAVNREDAISRYLEYPHLAPNSNVAITVNTPRAMLDLAAAGAGQAVLPCFVGDSDARLVRVGEEIATLRHRQWLVMNNDDRHRAEIRTVADRIVGLVKRHADAFAGSEGAPSEAAAPIPE